VRPAAEEPRAFSYDNCRGDRYYLHAGKTKTGKARYFFARDIRDGALAEMPQGFEVAESINGVVSVRRKKVGEVSIPPRDLALVESAISRYRHLHPSIFTRHGRWWLEKKLRRLTEGMPARRARDAADGLESIYSDAALPALRPPTPGEKRAATINRRTITIIEKQLKPRDSTGRTDFEKIPEPSTLVLRTTQVASTGQQRQARP
jgi:hypothetical protein